MLHLTLCCICSARCAPKMTPLLSRRAWYKIIGLHWKWSSTARITLLTRSRYLYICMLYMLYIYIYICYIYICYIYVIYINIYILFNEQAHYIQDYVFGRYLQHLVVMHLAILCMPCGIRAMDPTTSTILSTIKTHSLSHMNRDRDVFIARLCFL